MYILNKELTREIENIAENSGFSSLRMMENAGSAANKVICEHFQIKEKRVLIAVGKGNNGGDGFVLARKLFEEGAIVDVLLCDGMPTTDSSKEMLTKISHYPIRVYSGLDSDSQKIIDTADIIVDAIFGIGFKGDIPKNVAAILKAINQSKAYIVALDLPSGVECDSGKAAEDCINANLTISFIAVKPCHVLYPASDHCGKLIKVGIGLPQSIVDGVKSNVQIIEDSFVLKCLPKRKKNSHKGTFGTVLNICGSYGMTGAAYFSALSSIKSGVGLSKLLVPDSIYPILASSLPEAVYLPYADISEGLLKAEKNIRKADCVVIGCGLSQDDNASKLVFSALSQNNTPVVLDADGINIVASNIDILMKSEVEVVLTPHPAEMARLMGASVKEIQNNRFKAARVFSQKTGKIVVLKGANSIVATPDGNLFVCMKGNPGMATGGSGDVLAGIIGGLIAQGLSPESAAICGTHIHAAAGDIAANNKSMTSLTASDIISSLPLLFKKYEG